jgi:hypothetical protein
MQIQLRRFYHLHNWHDNKIHKDKYTSNAAYSNPYKHYIFFQNSFLAYFPYFQK